MRGTVAGSTDSLSQDTEFTAQSRKPYFQLCWSKNFPPAGLEAERKLRMKREPNAAMLQPSSLLDWTLAASLACLDIRGCASSVALVLAMRCTWSLSVQRWQICVANFQIFQPYQTMQQFMWQPNMLQVAKFLDAGMKRLQTADPNEGSNI